MKLGHAASRLSSLLGAGAIYLSYLKMRVIKRRSHKSY